MCGMEFLDDLTATISEERVAHCCVQDHFDVIVEARVTKAIGTKFWIQNAKSNSSLSLAQIVE